MKEVTNDSMHAVVAGVVLSDGGVRSLHTGLCLTVFVTCPCAGRVAVYVCCSSAGTPPQLVGGAGMHVTVP